MTHPEPEFTIAVRGAMNPAIHSPDWYRHLDLISEDQLAKSRGPGLLISAVASQFDAGTFKIDCTEDRWVVRAQHSQRKLATDLAIKVFEALEHTPVSAYGLNFNSRQPTGISDADERLRRRCAGQIGIDSEVVACQLRVVRQLDRRLLNLTVASVRGDPSSLAFLLNYHYSVGGDVYGRFDLGPLLAAALSADEEDSEIQVKHVIGALGER